MVNKTLILSLVVVGVAYFYYKGCSCSGQSKEGKIVITGSGQVKGIISVSRDGRQFYEWRGIPYAKAPVGDLRFKSPQPVEKWTGILDGSKHGARCAQLELFTLNFVGAEDCLFVNIHAPKLENQDKLLPVMVYIHGGGFWAMAGDDYTPEYLMDEDVILVTINYRLSILGFLNAGDKSIRGNMGLKDQVEALKWIKENIKHFGGDPQRTTIFGESAGGASVHYLMLAEEKTRGLFQKAITMSGSALTPWGYSSSKDSIEKSKSLAAKLNCPNGNGQEMAQCLQKLSLQELFKVVFKDMEDLSLITPYKKGIFLRPTVETVNDEEAFLTQSPIEIMTQGKASRVPLMSGVCANEGLISGLVLYRDEGSLEIMEENFDDLIAFQFGLTATFSAEEAKEKAQKLRDFYFPQSDLNKDEKIGRYVELMTDGYFVTGSNEVMSIQRKYSDVYSYVYDRPGGPSMTTLVAEFKSRYPFFIELAIFLGKSFWRQNILGIPPKDYGHSAHAQELPMLFPMAALFPTTISEAKPNDVDYKFSKDMVKLWVNFANDSKTEFRGTALPLNKKEGPLKYLKIDEKPILLEDPYAKRAGVWKSINFDKIYRK